MNPDQQIIINVRDVQQINQLLLVEIRFSKDWNLLMYTKLLILTLWLEIVANETQTT